MTSTTTRTFKSLTLRPFCRAATTWALVCETSIESQSESPSCTKSALTRPHPNLLTHSGHKLKRFPRKRVIYQPKDMTARTYLSEQQQKFFSGEEYDAADGYVPENS